MLQLARQPQVYIALQEYRFDWTRNEVMKFIEMWNEGKSIWDLAKRFRRSKIECAVLIMDLAEKGEIKPRKTGLFGSDEGD